MAIRVEAGFRKVGFVAGHKGLVFPKYVVWEFRNVDTRAAVTVPRRESRAGPDRTSSGAKSPHSLQRKIIPFVLFFYPSFKRKSECIYIWQTISRVESLTCQSFWPWLLYLVHRLGLLVIHNRILYSFHCCPRDRPFSCSTLCTVAAVDHA